MIMNTPGADHPITEVTFEIGNDLESCYKSLINRRFEVIDGDIRVGGGKKYVALGYKKGTSNFPITNIIGFLSNNKEETTIYENGYEYKMIQDGNKNGDIHKGSGKENLYLYYTTSQFAGSPIQRLIFASYPRKKISNMEVVQNFSRSLRQGDLDINAKRGGSTPFNYIIIIR